MHRVVNDQIGTPTYTYDLARTQLMSLEKLGDSGIKKLEEKK